MATAIDGGSVALRTQARFRAKSDPVSRINRIPPQFATVLADFHWTPLGPSWTYPDGSDSGAFTTPINTEITFVGNFVAPPGPPRSVVRWEWDFGDGVTAFGQTVTHTFVIPVPGLRVKLRATDDLGRRTSVGHQINLYTP